MTTKRLLAGAAASAALVAGVAIGAAPGGTADHLDAPLVAADGSTDINDLYVFSSPNDEDSVVLAMTVNPAAGVISGTEFNENADYQIYIHNDLDGTQEATFSLSFDDGFAGPQRVKVGGPGLNPDANKGRVGDMIELTNGGKLWAGLTEDPFFFDLAGFQNGLAFDGTDFFAGLDVAAIVLELPVDAVSDGSVFGVTAGTRVNGQQVDRMGRPAINTVLIPSGKKNAFNRQWENRQTALFRDDVVASITALSGDADYAEAVADILIPDILTVDLDAPVAFPNGRALADDVIDIAIGLVSNGTLPGDGVDTNDVEFLDEFPYLAPANGTDG